MTLKDIFLCNAVIGWVISSITCICLGIKWIYKTKKKSIREKVLTKDFFEGDKIDRIHTHNMSLDVYQYTCNQFESDEIEFAKQEIDLDKNSTFCCTPTGINKIRVARLEGFKDFKEIKKREPYTIYEAGGGGAGCAGGPDDYAAISINNRKIVIYYTSQQIDINENSSNQTLWLIIDNGNLFYYVDKNDNDKHPIIKYIGHIAPPDCVDSFLYHNIVSFIRRNILYRYHTEYDDMAFKHFTDDEISNLILNFCTDEELERYRYRDGFEPKGNRDY